MGCEIADTTSISHTLNHLNSRLRYLRRRRAHFLDRILDLAETYSAGFLTPEDRDGHHRRTSVRVYRGFAFDGCTGGPGGVCSPIPEPVPQRRVADTTAQVGYIRLHCFAGSLE